MEKGIFPEAKALTEFFIFPSHQKFADGKRLPRMGWTAPKKGVQERQGKGRDGMGKEMTETESDAGKETHDNTKLYGKLTDSFQGVRQRAAGTDIRNGRVRKGHQKLLKL